MRCGCSQSWHTRNSIGSPATRFPPEFLDFVRSAVAAHRHEDLVSAIVVTARKASTEGHRQDPKAQKHALRVQPADRDVADDERNGRAEVAEGPGQLGPVVVVAAQPHGMEPPNAER
jgi:hypothetical protein